VNEDRASRYHRLKRRAALVSIASTAALLAALLSSGGSAWLRDFAIRATGGATPAVVAVYVSFLACLHETIALPSAFYRSFVLERRYDLSREPLRTWLLDHVKASTLGLVLGIAGAEVAYLALRAWPRAWWAVSAMAFGAALFLLTRVTPTLLLPMFYRFTPLERESLRARLVALSARAGLPVLGVYEWGLGAKTRKANAALVGSGATRRILLSDTMLAEYSDDEIEVVMAHELGHHVHHDIAKALAVELVLLAGGFGVAAAALAGLWRRLGLHGPSDVAGLPVIVLACGAIGLAAQPFVNALSRLNERRADRYALRITGRREAFTSAIRRLGTQNLAEPRPSRVALWLFHTHPPIEERIRAAEQSAGLGMDWQLGIRDSGSRDEEPGCGIVD
jgi:STE24 endopeptidase